MASNPPPRDQVSSVLILEDGCQLRQRRDDEISKRESYHQPRSQPVTILRLGPGLRVEQGIRYARSTLPKAEGDAIERFESNSYIYGCPRFRGAFVLFPHVVLLRFR